MSKQFYSDITIVGAGPAGITAAMLLAKAGIQPLIIDRHFFPRDKVCGDALSGKVVDVLKKIDPGILSELNIQPIQVGSFGAAFVAPNSQSLRLPFVSETTSNKHYPPGYISKRMDFDDFLVNQAKEKFGLAIKEGVALTRFERRNNLWICKSDNGEIEIETKLVIAADGAQSVFAKDVGGIKVEKDHYSAGIRAYYSGVTGMDNENFIELHFMKNLLPGYFWIFPLPNGFANVGIGMRSDVVARKRGNLKKTLEDILQNHPVIRERFKNATLTGSITGFGLPLGSKKRNISGEGYLLAGDAASLIDPFTGEGIGNAMLSGMFAAQQAQQCLNADDYSKAFLKNYDKKVYGRLWNELLLSKRLQQLANYPWLFNFIVKKANASQSVHDLFSGMFSDLHLRKKLRQPSFYLNLLFNK